MAIYTDEAINELWTSCNDIKTGQRWLNLDWFSLCLKEQSKNYAHHGFLRRCKTLNYCIEKIFECCPPEADNVSSDDKESTTVYLQSFVFNTYGAVDNLAHILNYELDYGFSNIQVGLTKKFPKFREKLSERFKKKLMDFDDSGWFDYLVDFRHALAHRIPLYIPPYTVTPEEVELHNELDRKYSELFAKSDFKKANEVMREMENLGTFQPFMTHSFLEEHKKMYFHSQIIADWRTVLLLSDFTICELKNNGVKTIQ